MPTPPKKSFSIVKDQLDILKSFSENEVEFLVVGGHAVSAHTQPRYTKDLDLLIANDKTNSERVWKALVAFGAPVAGMSAEDFHDRPGQFYQMGVEPDRIDILQSIAGVDFADAWRDGVSGRIGGVAVKFISRHHLIQNKLAVGRPRDLGDVDELRKFEQKHLK